MTDKNENERCPLRDELPELFSLPKADRKLPPPPTIEREPAPQHPFVAFKQFVDDQFAAIVGTKRTSHNSLKAQMQSAWEEARQEEQEKYRRWTGRDATPDHDETIVQRYSQEDMDEAFEGAFQLLRRSAQLNAHISPDKVSALYMDDESSMLDLGSSLFGSWTMHAGPRWLSFDWFKHSTYSPLTLENNRHLPASNQWRMAFEDLIDASLGKEMRRRKATITGRRDPAQAMSLGNGLDWVLGLQCRGVLPPMLPSLYYSGIGFGTVEGLERWAMVQRGRPILSPLQDELSQLVREIATPSDEIDYPSLTEMDVYADSSKDNSSTVQSTHAATPLPPTTAQSRTVDDMGEELLTQWLSQLVDLAHSNEGMARSEDSTQQSTELSQQAATTTPTRADACTQTIDAASPPLPAKPMVLAALTTVQTTILPDGTVTKKTVLKQRFADGKEEITESMEVEHPNAGAPKAEHAEAAKKKGWFWS